MLYVKSPAATKRVAEMLLQYLEMNGVATAQTLADPSTRLVIYADGGCGLTADPLLIERAAAWCYTAQLPALKRLQQLRVLVEKFPTDNLGVASAEADALRLFGEEIASQMAAEAVKVLTLTEVAQTNMALSYVASHADVPESLGTQKTSEPIASIPNWLHWWSLATAFMASQIAAKSAGHAAATAYLSGSTAITIGALPAAIIAFGLVYGGFELIARTFSGRTTKIVMCALAPIALLLGVAMNGAVGQMQPVAQSSISTTPVASTTGYANASPARHEPVSAAEWDRVGSRFEADHPVLKLGKNFQVMQEHVDAVAVAGMSAQEIYDAAYDASVNDPRWTAVP
jgi:hypothetical protein